MGAQKVNFWDTTVGKTFRAAIYLGASVIISYFVSAVAQDPNLFGVLTPVINVVLVAAKNYFDKSTPNFVK